MTTPMIQMTKEQWESCAEDAYIAYGNKASWKTYDNKEMPFWSELTPKIQSRWVEAAKAVAIWFNIRPAYPDQL